MDYKEFFENYGYKTINGLHDDEYGPSIDDIFQAFAERIKAETEVFNQKITDINNSV